MRPPPHRVAPAIDCLSPNDPPRHAAREHYVIVCAGKTGIDSCLWLLGQGIAPDRLTWIMPRDSVLLDRATIQPGLVFADRIKASFTAQLRAIRDAGSFNDLFQRPEDAGALLRINPAIRPTMYRCATVTRAELEQLRRISDVVRMGHLLRIDADKMVLDGGAVAMDGRALYVTAPLTVLKSVLLHRFAIPAASPYKACGGANKYSARRWSLTSKPLIKTTP